MSHDDYPNDATTTGRLSLGVTISGQFDEPHSFFDEYFRDEDWFRLSATAGESYLVYGYGFALDMQVVGDFEPADGTIEVNGFSKPDISERVLVFTANKTRDYFVQVSNSITSESGSYELLAWQYEIPDSPVTSMTLVDGVTKTHRLETVIDVDYFKMPMVAGKTYEIRLEGFTDYFDFSDSFLPQLKILDPDNNLLEDKRVFARNKVARFEFTPTQTATYFAAVDANGLGGVGTYDIRKLELVDTAATGPSTTSRLDLKPNQTAAITSNFGPGDDIDWHQVDLVAGRWYQFGVVSDFSLVWMLLDRNNDLIEYRVGDQQHMFFRAAETGTHHLLLRDGVSDYTLYGVDNAAPPISLSSPYRNPVELLGNASITGQELFSLNEFPADQIQIVSEADFMVGTTKYDRYLLHSFPANELASLRFEGALQRGEYDVSLRALGGGTHSGWAQAVISSRPDNSDLLDSGHLWTADNTQRNRVYQLTYRFADSVPSYFEDGRFTGFQPISSTVEDIFREMFARSSGLHDKTITGYGNQISTITGKSIIYDDSEDADIQIFTADADIRAIGYHPGKYGLGDIVLDNDFYAGEAAPQPGSREYFEIVKAVATALGVKHFAHEFNREQSIVGTATYGISDDAIYPTTFGNQDISFFDSRFGWSRDTTPTVDVTEYKLGNLSEGSFFRTLHQSKGGNSIDARASALPVLIDLREGGKSHVVGGDISQVYLVAERELNFGVAIQNAHGSEFDDQITGNHGVAFFSNTIFGRGGNDLIAGLSGDDLLHGGLGDDTYLYETGDGHDTIYESPETGAGGIDTLQIKGKFGLDRLEDDLTAKRVYNDLIIDLDMNGESNRHNGTITIKDMNSAGSRIEKLDLRNFQSQIGVISLVSIWDQATHEKQRFSLSGGSDQFGLLATPTT